jgi:hypothetical protein
MLFRRNHDVDDQLFLMISARSLPPPLNDRMSVRPRRTSTGIRREFFSVGPTGYRLTTTGSTFVSSSSRSRFPQ